MLAIALLIPVTAMAEGECQQDRQKFCKDETKANVGACLDQHTAELSEACKAVREARALAAPASAETSPKPPSAQGSDTAPSAEAKPGSEAKPSSEAEQPNAPTVKPEPKPEAAQKDSEAAPTEPGSQILINIDKSLQQMTVFVDGIEKYSWPVSTGKYGYSTPSGTFTPTSMNEVWYSKQWDNSPMPHSIFFMKDGHAIHGSHEVKNLGKPVSHGCVRISPENAAILYDLVKTDGMENTKVVLAGVTPGDEFKRAGGSTLLSAQWGSLWGSLVRARTRLTSTATKARSFRRVVPWRSAGLLPAPARILPNALQSFSAA